ncbi:MAG: hypothetical protein ACI9BH_001762 [Paracoccaceae bacterium]
MGVRLFKKVKHPGAGVSALADQTKMARQFIQAIPHARALGMELTEIGNGQAAITMPYADHIVGDPKTGVIHGGAVSAVMDTCCGAAVMSHPSGPTGTATIDLRIDYMRAATPGQAVTARATCYHVGRSVAFVRATATDVDTGNPVATASGSFTVESQSGAFLDKGK